jgi:hypothetical protein
MKGKRQGEKRGEQQVEIEGRDLISIITLRVTTVRHLSLSILTLHTFVRLFRKFACCDVVPIRLLRVSFHLKQTEIFSIQH